MVRRRSAEVPAATTTTMPLLTQVSTASTTGRISWAAGRVAEREVDDPDVIETLVGHAPVQRLETSLTYRARAVEHLQVQDARAGRRPLVLNGVAAAGGREIPLAAMIPATWVRGRSRRRERVRVKENDPRT